MAANKCRRNGECEIKGLKTSISHSPLRRLIF
jgi:hypothetical protein